MCAVVNRRKLPTSESSSESDLEQSQFVSHSKARQLKKQKLCLPAPPPPPLPPTVPSSSVHEDDDGSVVPSSSHSVLDHRNAPLTLVPASEQLPVTPVSARQLHTPVTCHTGTDTCKIVYFVLEFLPRCMQCRRGLAMKKLSVCLSVCLSNAWIVTKLLRTLQCSLSAIAEHLVQI